MKKLIDMIIGIAFEWFKKKNRWPLLLIPVGLFIYFQFISLFYEKSFHDTFFHEHFLLYYPIIFLLSGVVYIFVGNHWKQRAKLGVSIILSGLLLLSVSYLLVFPRLPKDNLVVSIAQFYPINEEANSSLFILQSDIEDALNDKVQNGAPLRVQKENRSVQGNSIASREKDAIKIGRKAHIIIWGEGRSDDSAIKIKPWITISRPFFGIKNQGGKVNTGGYVAETIEFRERLSSRIADIIVLIQGIAYYKAGLYNDAVRIFDNEKSYYSYIWLGLTYRKMGQNADSLSVFKRAYEINPYDHVVLANLAEAYRLTGKEETSKKLLEKAHSINPENPAILNNLAIHQLSDGQYQKALENFERALEGNDNPKFRSNYAFCLYELGQIGKAVKNWEKSVSKLQNLPKGKAVFLDAQAGLAVGEYALGKTDSAISRYRQVVRENSNYGNIDKLETQLLWPEHIRSKAAELIKIIGD